MEARKPEERRLAAILAADVAGYSRLTQADEEGTLARLRTLRRELFLPKITEHRGRVVKTTGDGILVEFASVVDAVRSAIEVQRAMATQNADLPADRRLELRIGINLGDVVVEEDGDLMGDGVNVAARLEALAAPGGVCVSEDAYRYLRGKVDAAFTDLGAQYLKNIAEPVRVYAATALRTAPSTAVAATTSSRARRLSIVVLPFANLSGDPDQDYFVDGITESLTTDLSRIPGAFVIARNTAFTYKGKAMDARLIGRELGVRYVMEGSVQTGRERIRVNAQLIDAETGAHLWAERFDKPRADLFDMQDEITARLARTADIELRAAEVRRALSERPNNLDSVDLTMRGWAICHQRLSLDSLRRARPLFEEALRLDDSNIRALHGLIETFTLEVEYGDPESRRTELIAAAEAAIAKVEALAPSDALAHFFRGRIHYVLRAPELALREFELAVGLDRNQPWNHAWTGGMKIHLGQAEETEAHVAEAIRISPHDPLLFSWYQTIGVADLYLGRLERAVDNLRKATELNPSATSAHFYLAAALAVAGRDGEAVTACAAGHGLAPSFSISKFRADARSTNPIYLAQRERIYEGMRKAGVPEE